MPEVGIRSTYSQCPFQILIVDQSGETLSGATAFFHRTISGRTFLITNRHNVTGLDNFSGQYLAPVSHERRPLTLTLKLMTWVQVEDGSGKRKFGIMPHTLKLYSEDRLTPLWQEHPKLGAYCDVVALPFVKPGSVPENMHNYANEVSTHRIPVKPGNTLFIIGFPRNLSSGIGLPIWKSGYIASEPNYDINVGGKLQQFGGMLGGQQLPAIFIDGETRQGMSGSPVFCKYSGTWSLKAPYEEVDQNSPLFWERDDVAWNATALEFIGIYSGRAPGNEGEAALGLCWKKEILEDICCNETPPKHPHS